MQVLFESRSPEAQALREVAVWRTRFVLRRLHTQLPRARVHLDDVNGPRGGVDKRCVVELRSDLGAAVVARSRSHDWHSALDLALERALRALRRLWQRQRTRHRAAAPERHGC